ncbi:TonB family protein [Sulfurimonas sp. HSL1-2]|uniref:energy transducer TonB n=1 Tax=Thiomicrolovo zhangzhouensis TaxID=3131933 RepID=UPI0031F8D354
MARSPQAFLVSLSLHLTIGIVLLIVVLPKIPMSVSAEAPHYCLSLSRVAPKLPPKKSEQAVAPAPAAVKPVPVKEKAPEKVVKRPEIVRPAVVLKTPAVKPLPVVKEEPAPFIEETQPETAMEVMTETEPVAAAEGESTAEASSAEQTGADESASVQSSESYMNEHLAIIAQLLQRHLYYPRMARKRHIEGEVVASFRVEPDGSVHDVTIQKHAREILDRAAIRTITSLSGRLPHPRHALTLNVPIRFVLK